MQCQLLMVLVSCRSLMLRGAAAFSRLCLANAQELAVDGAVEKAAAAGELTEASASMLAKLCSGCHTQFSNARKTLAAELGSAFHSLDYHYNLCASWFFVFHQHASCLLLAVMFVAGI